jgi:hypothetical protein
VKNGVNLKKPGLISLPEINSLRFAIYVKPSLIFPEVPIFAPSLATFEGLIGQLYPAILIARLVSMEFESSKRKKEKMN